MHIPENTNTHAHGNIGKGKNSIVVYPLHVMYVRVSWSRCDTSAGKNRRVKKDGKGTRKGITYQQEFLAEKKGESKEIRLQRIGYMRGKIWDGERRTMHSDKKSLFTRYTRTDESQESRAASRPNWKGTERFRSWLYLRGTRRENESPLVHWDAIPLEQPGCLISNEP